MGEDGMDTRITGLDREEEEETKEVHDTLEGTSMIPWYSVTYSPGLIHIFISWKLLGAVIFGAVGLLCVVGGMRR